MIPAERVHASIEARTAQTTGHRDKGSITRCPACHAPVIRALDDTVAAFTAVADPWPIDRAGELTALLTHRDTYALTLVPRLTLRRRDRWQIAGHPADTLTVVAAHACHAPLGTPIAPTSQEPARDRVPF
jgi:hypothetical protein